MIIEARICNSDLGSLIQKAKNKKMSKTKNVVYYIRYAPRTPVLGYFILNGEHLEIFDKKPPLPICAQNNEPSLIQRLEKYGLTINDKHQADAIFKDFKLLLCKRICKSLRLLR